ncbi:hypothetical protein [Gymnodinialimonas hymeniacidonis]|uniref:hypothetical protein n=1 Tax=Gymnodinialimonas hymeniacidonis TaxID=3126508 RepID=UPI0034C6117C
MSPSNTKTRILALSAALASTLAFPAAADFVGVSRCAAADGTNTPALHFVSGGERFLVVVGSGGLTRSIAFNERRALEWARNSGLFPEGTVFGNYSDYVCGLLNEDEEVEEQPAPAPEEPEQPEEPQTCDFCEENPQ